MITRWLLGFCFSKHDIELLDNPIPDALYCRPCKAQPQSRSPRAIDLEGGEGGSVDTFGLGGSSGHCSTDNMLVTSEPTSTSAAHVATANPGIPRKQRTDSFNITHEVDSCDLWKNLVKLDAPLPSPRETPKFHIGGVVQSTDTMEHATLGDGGVGAWHHHHHHHHPSAAAEENRTLCTLEECDTDLESQSQLPDYENISSPYYISLQSPRDDKRSGRKGFSLPSPTSPSNNNRYEHAQWNPSSKPHVRRTSEPVLLSYQSTSV